METNRHLTLRTMVVRSLRNNARIAAWTLVTLATCAALVTIFTTVTFEIGRKMSQELRRLGANAVAEPAGTANWKQFEETAQAQGAQTVVLEARVGMIEQVPVAVVAADAGKLARLTPYWAVTGTRAHAADECLVGRRVAEHFGFKPGQTMRIDGQTLRVTGVFAAGDEDDDRVFVTRRGIGTGGVSYALVSVTGGKAAITRWQQALAANGAGIELRPLRQVVGGEEHVLQKVHLLFVTALTAVLVLTVLGVTASMLARVVERRKEFALLRAIGAKRVDACAFLLAESATVGVVGALVGFAIGTLLARAVVQRIFHVATGPQWLSLATALGTTTVVALLAGGIAATRMLRFPPAAALRGE